MSFTFSSSSVGTSWTKILSEVKQSEIEKREARSEIAVAEAGDIRRLTSPTRQNSSGAVHTEEKDSLAPETKSAKITTEKNENAPQLSRPADEQLQNLSLRRVKTFSGKPTKDVLPKTNLSPAASSRPPLTHIEAAKSLTGSKMDLRRHSFIENEQQRLRQSPTAMSEDESGSARAAAYKPSHEWTSESERHALREVKSHHDRGRESFWKDPKNSIGQAKTNVDKARFLATQISYAEDRWGVGVQKYRTSLPGQKVGPGIENNGPGVMFSRERGFTHLMDRDRTPEQRAAANQARIARDARRAERKAAEGKKTTEEKDEGVEK